jgi:epoxide hydrolase
VISRELGLVAPRHLAGVHLNMLFPRFTGEPADLTEQEKSRIEAMRRFRSDGSGYYVIQATRPQALAYGLTDSPAGQLAWIAEKFGEWTDNGLPDQAVDRDQLLTNVTVYWLTATAGSSARLYYEAGRAGDWSQPATSTVPTGIAVFPREIAPPIRRFAEQSNNIVHWTEFGRGGHFAAMEQPDLLVGDIREFFRELR